MRCKIKKFKDLEIFNHCFSIQEYGKINNENIKNKLINSKNIIEIEKIYNPEHKKL